jgi:hypothetical protein
MLTVALIALLGVVAPASGSAGAASRGSVAAVRLPTPLAGPGAVYEVRPKTIYYTGDGSGVIGVLRRSFGQTGPGRGYLRWATWDRVEASGEATLWLKLSTPIATSPFARVRAGVLLRDPRDGHFTQLLLQYRVHGQIINDHRCVPARGKVTEWRILIGARCLR